jgi:PAS domain S-box-containing protein
MSEQKPHIESRQPSLSEEWARLLIESIGDYAIFMLDPTGHVRTWNKGAQRLKGYTASEIIGRHFSTFYPATDIAAGKCELELSQATLLGRFEDEGWRLRKDGTLFWANVVITAMRDASGHLTGFAKVTRDLTERRETEVRLRLSEERFRLLVDSVKDYAIFMLDTQGHVVTWNNGAARLKGYTAREIIGEHLSRFYPPEEVARGRPEVELETAAREGRFEDEGWRLRKDGTLFWANVILTAMRDDAGRLVGFAKVTRELTERRRAEEERIRLAQSEEAVRLRDEFLAIAAHELKTPLTALQLQLHNLKARVGPLEPRVRTGFERAVRVAKRMSDLVESLLDVSRLSTGKLTLNPERLDLTTTVAEVTDRLREAASQAGCAIHVQGESPVEGSWDRLRIEQVLINLLSNAFKYAAGSPVKISITRALTEGILVIADKGPGIPPEALTRLFQRFERAAPMRHFGGLGLGLYVARQIVEAHGGTLSVSNPPEGGARFTVRLPMEDKAKLPE